MIAGDRCTEVVRDGDAVVSGDGAATNPSPSSFPIPYECSFIQHEAPLLTGLLVLPGDGRLGKRHVPEPVGDIGVLGEQVEHPVPS